MAWTVENYVDVSGVAPVEEFIHSLPPRDQGHFAWTVELLKEFGVRLRMPYARHLEGKLWELRVRTGSNAHRVIYFAHSGRRFVLLHGFTKKTDKTPRRELEMARKRMMDFISEEGGER